MEEDFVPTKLINVRHATRANKTYPKRIKSALARKHCPWRRLKADPNSSAARDQYGKLIDDDELISKFI